jgi:hypothetical protein
VTEYAPNETMRTARARYFQENQFGEDGGYGDAWVDFKLGPIPFPFPNTPARVRAVGYHDLHHVLTGYRTDFPGELEISAWEIGAWCKDFVAAWQLNLGGMTAGLFFMPRKVFRAFVRGRRSQSLYGLELEPLLEQTVGETRAQMHVPEGGAKPTLADVALFALASVLGLVVGAITLVLAAPLAPIAYLVLARKRARETLEAR